MYFTIVQRVTCAALILFVFFTTAAQAQLVDSTRLSGPKQITFYSKILNEKRKVTIQTPEDMNAFDRYPVLYVLDGEAHATMVGGQVQYLSDAYKIIPKLIVVSIHNTDRTRDLTPTHSIVGPDGKKDTSATAFGVRSGGGEKFLQFIKQELMPYIDAQYLTAPYTILSGHSLGGLIAVYCLVNHPEYFNAYIAISPSLQWDNNWMLTHAAQTLKPASTLSKTLFFSDANEDAAFHQNQLSLDSILKAKNIHDLKYKQLFYPEESHISEPVKAFYDGIRFVYPAWHLPYNSAAFRKTMTAETIKEHYKQLTKNYGYTVVPLHDEMNAIGRFLRNDPQRLKDAVAVLQINAQNYPTSAEAQITLGDTYLKMDNKILALETFKKAFALDPSNEGLQKKIKTISQK